MKIKQVFIWIAIILFWFIGLAYAGDKNVIPYDLSAESYESITIANSSIGFTTTKLTNTAKGVFCTLETAQVRFRMDGTAPTATEGHILEIGQSLTIYNFTILRNIRFIRTGDTSGVLKVTYLR